MSVAARQTQITARRVAAVAVENRAVQDQDFLAARMGMGRDAETGRKAADKGDMTGLFGLFQDAARDAVLGAGLPIRRFARTLRDRTSGAP